MAILLATLEFTGCQSAGPVPVWNGKLFAGDSKEDGISRNNPGEPHQTIKCSSADIDGYICMSLADFRSFVNTYIGQCKEWKQGARLTDADLLWLQVKP